MDVPYILRVFFLQSANPIPIVDEKLKDFVDELSYQVKSESYEFYLQAAAKLPWIVAFKITNLEWETCAFVIFESCQYGWVKLSLW